MDLDSSHWHLGFSNCPWYEEAKGFCHNFGFLFCYCARKWCTWLSSLVSYSLKLTTLGVVVSSFGVALPGLSMCILASGEGESLSNLVPYEWITFLMARKWHRVWCDVSVKMKEAKICLCFILSLTCGWAFYALLSVGMVWIGFHQSYVACLTEPRRRLLSYPVDKAFV